MVKFGEISLKLEGLVFFVLFFAFAGWNTDEVDRARASILDHEAALEWRSWKSKKQSQTPLNYRVPSHPLTIFLQETI